MTNGSEFGIPADERQQFDHYRGAYKAFRSMILMAMAGAGVALFLFRDHRMAGMMVLMALAGLGIYSYHLWKTGWVEYIQEQGAGGAVWKRMLIGGILAGVFWFFYLHVVEKEPLAPALRSSVVYGLLMAVGSWLLERFITSRKSGAGGMADDES